MLQRYCEQLKYLGLFEYTSESSLSREVFSVPIEFAIIIALRLESERAGIKIF